MTERVEEIRRWHNNSGHKAHFPHCETCEVVTALAQAEREREEDQERAARLATWLDAPRAEVERLLIENDAARKSIGEAWDTAVANGGKIRSLEAEVERLRMTCDAHITVIGDKEADLARVRAALEKIANIVECLAVNEAQVRMFNWENVLAEARAALEGR